MGPNGEEVEDIEGGPVLPGSRREGGLSDSTLSMPFSSIACVGAMLFDVLSVSAERS